MTTPVDQSDAADALFDALREGRPDGPKGLARILGRELLTAEMGLSEPPVVGRYAVRAMIGRGGMGTVYRATDPLLDRWVALKVLNDRDIDAKTRLVDEARRMASIDHPNVLAVLDMGVERGNAWVVTELVEDGSLRAWLDRNEGVSTAGILQRLLQAARGLAAIHRAGLVHGDFKPDNVLVDGDGVARVCDFGLAVPIPDARDASDERISIGGTARYLAPELVEGAPPSPLSDQYAFAVSAGELLDGRPRSDRLEAWLDRGRAHDPAERWPTMEAVVTELENRLQPPRRVAVPDTGELVLLARDAPTRTAFLDGVLEWLQRYLGFDSVLLGDVSDPAAPPRVEGFDPALLAQFGAHPELYAGPLVALDLASSHVGRTVTDIEVLDQVARSRSALHADLLGRKGTRVMAYARLHAAGRSFGSLQISRNLVGSRFAASDRALLDAVVPVISLGLALRGGQDD